MKFVYQNKQETVVHPTGSGKRLCFQFPPVFQDKKAIVITPTISLMQDQVYNLQQRGIKGMYLGSVQLDKEAESNALDPSSDCGTLVISLLHLNGLQNLIR